MHRKLFILESFPVQLLLRKQPSPDRGSVQELLATWKYACWPFFQLCCPTTPAACLAFWLCLSPSTPHRSIFPGTILCFPSWLYSTSVCIFWRNSYNNINLDCTKALDGFLISLGLKMRTHEETNSAFQPFNSCTLNAGRINSHPQVVQRWSLNSLQESLTLLYRVSADWPWDYVYADSFAVENLNISMKQSWVQSNAIIETVPLYTSKPLSFLSGICMDRKKKVGVRMTFWWRVRVRVIGTGILCHLCPLEWSLMSI